MNHLADNDISPARVRSRALLMPWLVALAALSSIVLAYQFFALIDTYAVNLLFSDQWDTYNPLFREQGLWDTFSYQHGPHRQGLGLIVTKIVAGLTQWNARAEAFTVGAIIAGAMLVAFYLKRRLFGMLTLADAIIPLIFLTTAQYESLVITPNLAHGALPVLLVLLSALAWGLRHSLARYTAVVVLNFLLIFTGFGIFMGLITPLLLVLDIYQHARNDHGNAWVPPFAALPVALASAYAFSVGYVFQPAIGMLPLSAPAAMGVPLVRRLDVGAFSRRQLRLISGAGIDPRLCAAHSDGWRVDPPHAHSGSIGHAR